MVKIVIDAGHGFNTPGKRSPDDEREWSFNNKVANYTIAKLKTYKDVEILRVDDPTGKSDVPLRTRTDLANKWKADVYASIHHNALAGEWGKHSGIETYTMDNPTANPKSIEIAGAVHPRVVLAMGISDRGMKRANFHVLRESAMPAFLSEGGFMDSEVDITKLRDKNYLKAQGEAIAEGLAVYFKLQLKATPEGNSPPPKKGVSNLYKPSSQSIVNSTSAVFKRLEGKEEGTLSPTWREKLVNGTLTDSDAIGILYVALDCGLLEERK
ncbi:N-acetylmuramoyl-L-alanine amidase family protein [Sporosarcina limicola]|uniref:N-acetylmuramoyl-L-alanine amidase n=1 Tax=Sporosarcina limicola TaxID=34101 RepID=A0A927MIZ7_9BACL|nr:N-acetylmuramoyl-L-alanine amidase [Sporosarcina limicola]MBE1554721.1 N-acetylmuramoyl-L-alanine amidase [Sporosarcina limicola]